MSVLTDLRNRGIRGVFFVVCDGLKGLPEIVGNAWRILQMPCSALMSPSGGLPEVHS